MNSPLQEDFTAVPISTMVRKTRNWSSVGVPAIG
jgi:hypothetical protein